MGADAFKQPTGRMPTSRTRSASACRRRRPAESKSHANAVSACRAEQADTAFADSHGGKTFDQFYGTGKNGNNAFGKCVSSKAKESNAAADTAVIERGEDVQGGARHRSGGLPREVRQEHAQVQRTRQVRVADGEDQDAVTPGFPGAGRRGAGRRLSACWRDTHARGKACSVTLDTKEEEAGMSVMNRRNAVLGWVAWNVAKQAAKNKARLARKATTAAAAPSSSHPPRSQQQWAARSSSGAAARTATVSPATTKPDGRSQRAEDSVRRGSCALRTCPLGFPLRRARSGSRSNPDREAVGGSRKSVGRRGRNRHRLGELFKARESGPSSNSPSRWLHSNGEPPLRGFPRRGDRWRSIRRGNPCCAGFPLRATPSPSTSHATARDVAPARQLGFAGLDGTT